MITIDTKLTISGEKRAKKCPVNTYLRNNLNNVAYIN